MKSSTRPGRAARIKDGQWKSLIREERENGTFPIPWSKKPRMAFCDLAIVKSLICEERENDTFHFPWSKKSRQDFLRPYQ
jgi:hypothetical protein